MGLLRGFFATALASVHIDMRDCHIQLRIVKGGNIIQEETKVFKTAPNALPIEAAYYLNRIKRKYPYTYVATISHSIHQGAFEAFGDADCQKHGVNPAHVARIVIGKRWTAFIDKDAIEQERANFIKAPSLDFLFSPFLLLYQAIKSYVDNTKKLYVFLQQASITMLIMDRSKLYFGIIQPLEDTQIADSEEDGTGGADDALHAPLEEIGVLDDLDNMEMQQDFQEVSESSIGTVESEKKALADFARIKNVTDVIKESLNEFYKNDAESDFVGEVILVDALSTSDKAITYLKTNLMIDTSVVNVNVCGMIMEIAQRDLSGV